MPEMAQPSDADQVPPPGRPVIGSSESSSATLLRSVWRGLSRAPPRALRPTAGAGAPSYNICDRASGRWHQTWVDDAGLLLQLEGSLQDRAMTLQGRVPGGGGAEQLHRITWTPRDDGTIRQLWEQSDDAGRTWSVAFDGRYVRRP